MHTQPTAQELIAAVSQHLSERVVPTLSDPKVRYHTLVAIHALGMVQRELGQGEQALWQEWAVLTALFGEARPHSKSHELLLAETADLNRRLAEQILAGTWDDDPNILMALKQQVATKLDVSNPKFKRDL